MQEMQVSSLDQEDPLEKEKATHSIFLAWEIPWTEPQSQALVGYIQPTGSKKSWTQLSDLAQAHIRVYYLG